MTYSNPMGEPLLTVKDVAGYLKTSEGRIYILIGGGLPGIRISPRRWRFRRKDVESYLDSHLNGDPSEM